MNQNIHSINNSSIIDEKIPKGYKKTSVGTIPEDWSVKTLGKLGEFKNGLNKSSGDFGSGQEMVNLNDVFEKRSLNSLDSFSTMVKCNQKEINEYSLKQGDVLFVRSSVKPEGVGLTTLIEEDLNDKVYSGFIIRYRDKGDDLELYYKKYCFDATYFRRKLLNYSTISANTNINQKSLEKLEVIIPSKAEQKEIASILSVWDKAIELKEKLIEQKKEQKKGLMQKLLTGEVRLPGFEGEWKQIKLGKLVKLQGGYAFKSSEFRQEGIPIIRISNIVPEITDYEQEFVYYDKIDISENFLVKTGDILIAMSGATTGKVGIYKKNEIAYLNQRVGKFVNLEGKSLDYDFLYYLVKSPMFELQLMEELSTGAQPNISSKQIENFRFRIPSLEEQEGISSILKQIDKSISLQKKEIGLLVKQKKGLMQLLLTGKVRVKV